MTGFRLFAWITAVVLLPAFAPAQKLDTASPVQLTPEIVVAGSPELIRVNAPGASHVSGEWLGRNVQFFQGKHPGEWTALAGVDVDAPIGPSTLKIHVIATPDSADFSRTINIHAAHYRTESLGVQPKFVEPG